MPMTRLRTGFKVSNLCLTRCKILINSHRNIQGAINTTTTTRTRSRTSRSTTTSTLTLSLFSSTLTPQALLLTTAAPGSRTRWISSDTQHRMADEYNIPYNPPDWAKHLKDAPTRKLQLACIPTMIHRWHLPGLPKDVQVYIKRDDMTDCTLSGNKVRKLEFLLEDALHRGCRHVITCGGVQSNHCRAVAVACAQLGLKAHLLLRTDDQDLDAVNNVGNVLLDRLSGAELYYIPKKSPYVTHIKPRMEALADAIKTSTGEKSYHVPVGGTNAVGVWGYLNAFNELIQQDVVERFDDIVFACGSGGTADGLSLGNHLSKSGLAIHGIAVSDDAKYFHWNLNELIGHFGLDTVRAEQILDVVEGYKGLGYGISQQKELDFAVRVARTTGIMTDPVYMGKAVYGLVQELQTNRARFKGNRILFIHTGGVFGMYDGTLHKWLTEDPQARAQLHSWPEVTSPAPALAGTTAQ